MNKKMNMKVKRLMLRLQQSLVDALSLNLNQKHRLTSGQHDTDPWVTMNLQYRARERKQSHKKVLI